MPSTSNELLAESTRSISDASQSTAATTSRSIVVLCDIETAPPWPRLARSLARAPLSIKLNRL